MSSPILTPVMTLVEFLKNGDIPDQTRPLVSMFAKSSDVMEALPWEGLTGPVYLGFRQASIPQLGFRGINEPSTSGAGTLTPFQEATYVIDHDIPVDRVLVEQGGQRRRALEEAGAMAAAGELWLNSFLKGDNSLNPRVFNGLQKRSLQFGRTMHNSTTAGGAPLSLSKLDQAIQNTRKATHIIFPWAAKYLLIAAARNTQLTGFVMQSWDEAGKPKITYAGLPILFGYEKDFHPAILPFTEVGAGGGAAQTSSLYVVSFGEQGLRGIQLSPLQVRDVGLLQDSITYNTHVSWNCGIVDEHPFCFTRLDSWTLAAIVA